MKKIVMTALITSMMIVPFGAAAAANQVELPTPPAQVEYVPGRVPAQVSVCETMSPAIHAAMLAMMNHQNSKFDATDSELAWESLYNMLSMYGQLDERAEYQDENLVIPSETVFDYAAALLPDLSVLGELPASLTDRMTYNADNDSYLVVCGNDEMSELRMESTPLANGQLLLSGSLVYLEDDSELAQFEAVVEHADNLLGCTVVSMEVL